jgi:hypothetical protein
MLHLYRAALAERRRNPALGEGTLSWDDDGPDGVLSFTRDPGFRCVVARRSGCASRLRWTHRCHETPALMLTVRSNGTSD